jgi:phage tail sheath protein FI
VPVELTYPGVYLEELPSGAATIAGVSTSIGAFVGWAPRGPLNTAKRILSFSAFERTYGFDVRSDLAYAVRQFFLNGGSECWVVRVASGVGIANADLPGAGGNVLRLTALDGGAAGNNIAVQVDYQTTNPASTFNLTLTYQDPDNPGQSVTESFGNLSMNSSSPRYALTSVNNVSKLVSVSRLAGATVGGGVLGYSESADLTDISGTVNALHNQFKLVINGSSPITVTLTAANVSGVGLAAQIGNLKTAVETAVTNAGITGFVLAASGTSRFRMTSGVGGENSYVRVLPGDTADISGLLEIGVANGGTEVDAAATVRPDPQPQGATVTGTSLGATALDALPDATHHLLQISIDNLGPDTIDVGAAGAVGAALEQKLGDVATRLTAAVRAARPSSPGYKNFSAAVTGAGSNQLLLESGSTGSGSRISVAAAGVADIAASLLLLASTPTTPRDFTLAGGTDHPPVTLGDRIAAFTPATPRHGIYALDDVDLFNIFCLPGVTDGSILGEAAGYCRKRRAFFIIDPPQGLSVDAMEQYVKGTNLPKSPNWEYCAVYYPWLQIQDPQQGGKLRSIPPCGTLAGIYARTDSGRGVWKAPAGTEAGLAGAQALDYILTDTENGILNPRAVNCLRFFGTYGIVSWGARTVAGDNNNALADYRYVPVRRLALFLEESLYRGTQWVVFEPNDEPLWAQIRLTVSGFLHGLFRQGAFAGITPRQAYFVKCDKDTTTQNDINLGRVNILVGFAPLKPAEFVVIQIQQIAGQLAV